jgi:hypothetical protein
MAIVKNGFNLSSSLLQPGWTVMSDGFGLVTCTATFKIDKSASVPTTLRGQAFPAAGYTYLKAHKSSLTYDALEYKIIKVDYVGIDPTINSGAWTNPNTNSANGLTAENITSNPNFFEQAPGFSVGPIAGLPSDFGGLYDDSTLGPPVTVIAVPPSPNAGKPVVVPSSEGYNGACFETGMGGRFIGFVDPEVPYLYGKTQYLAAGSSFSGVVYVNVAQSARILIDSLGKAVSGRAWGPITLLPGWSDVGAGEYGNVNLLSQVNVEEFGTLFKVNYEIRYSKEGWPPDVYINSAS